MRNLSWKDISRKPIDDAYAMRITPEGIDETTLPLREKAKNFVTDLSRIGFIVSSEAKAKVFDKVLGQIWLLLEPVIMAALYYFITTVVFSYAGEQRQFLFILTAVVFWRWFSRTIDGAPMSIVAYGSVLKQTRFPVIMVVLAFMATEAFFFAMSTVVLVGFLAAYGHYPNLNYVYLPLVLAAQFSLTLFLTIVFASIGTFVKDLGGVLYAITGIWWYLSPGIYPVSKIPKEWLWVYMLNPFAHILPAYRDILIDGVAPQLLPLTAIFVLFTVLSFLVIKAFNWARYYFFSFL